MALSSKKLRYRKDGIDHTINLYTSLSDLSGHESFSDGYYTNSGHITIKTDTGYLYAPTDGTFMNYGTVYPSFPSALYVYRNGASSNISAQPLDF